MDEGKLRAWWFHRQGLDRGLAGVPPADVLERTGWARSMGGSGPYLGFHGRTGAGREAIDGAVAALEIHELPSARGCTYVVPASAFALALELSQGFGQEADMRVARKLGVTDAEIDGLCTAVLDALGPAPLAPDELRAATGGASRSLGEAGKKKGLSTTLPLALGRLQSAGEIRRVPVNGRLDQQRYRYTLWRPNPLDGFRLTPEECNVELARLFFTWIGPASLAELQGFAGLSVKAAKAAVEPLHLVPLAAGDERLLLPDQRRELEDFTAPPSPRYALVSNLDGILLLRRDVRGLLAPADTTRSAAGEKGPEALASLEYLPNHAILDRGRLIGFWEYDPGPGEIVWTCFIRPDAALRQQVRATERFIRDDLADMRAFSLDSPKSRQPRLDQLRAAQAH
ncbi:MAG TPA: crosslink repair DNA glycosylase YcaQ family protein [Thermoanaerobaculia bacterium]|nr:crosslink repair DNA glycosylase YcaQ family protein [Thermoanaerobaculia bacterium]